MGTAFARVVHHIWGYSDPVIYHEFLCLILVVPLLLIPYFVHLALSKALPFYDDSIPLTCQH